MNPEIKAKWIEALRSGKYKQGTGYLKSINDKETYYCCLGVLCEINNEPIEPDFKTKDVNGDTYPNDYFSFKCGLDFDQVQRIADLNDLNKLSFDAIADYIEKEF